MIRFQVPDDFGHRCLEISLLFLFALVFVEPYLLIQSKTHDLTIPYLVFALLKNGALLVAFLGVIPGGTLRNDRFVTLALVASFLAYGIAMGATNGSVVFGNIPLTIKNGWLWLVLLALISTSRMAVSVQLLRTMGWIAIGGGLLNIGYSVVARLTYDGDPSVFYFHELFHGMGMFMEFNYVRDGAVRGFGLVASCLTLSQLLMIPTAVVLAPILALRRWSMAWLLLVMLGGLILTQTRNPLLAVAASTGAFLLWKATRRFWLVVLYDLAYMGAVFWYIWYKWKYDFQSLDLSALDRIIQLDRMWGLFLARPFGYGIGYAGVANNKYAFMTDLSFGTYLLDLGIVPVALLYALLLLLLRKALVQGFAIEGGRLDPWKAWTGTSVFLVGNSLLLLSEFSNIFDHSLMAFAIFLGLGSRWLRQSGTSPEAAR